MSFSLEQKGGRTDRCDLLLSEMRYGFGGMYGIGFTGLPSIRTSKCR